MAGSMHHVIEDGMYLGDRFVENLGDAKETIDELVFVLLQTTTEVQRNTALLEYQQCDRGEKPWPAWWMQNFYAGGPDND